MTLSANSSRVKRYLLYHARMRTIQWRRPEKKEKTCSADSRVSTKVLFHYLCSITHLPGYLNAKILKAFPKTFPPKWNRLNAQQKKKMRQEKQKKRGSKSLQGKGNTCLSFLSFWYFKTLSIGTASAFNLYLLLCSQVLYWLSWK